MAAVSASGLTLKHSHGTAAELLDYLVAPQKTMPPVSAAPPGLPASILNLEEEGAARNYLAVLQGMPPMKTRHSFQSLHRITPSFRFQVLLGEAVLVDTT